ncbi:MAG TPA: manganese efflux pump MntP family protein [bacterium]|nr:manganese efflux pump MntP family protein [bacterium]
MLSFPALFTLAVALSMDAFAVAVCYGLALTVRRRQAALLIGLFFGGFQALMPILGALAGATVVELLRTFAPWLAFLLLTAVGGKMLYDARHPECPVIHRVALLPLTGLAVATSIDALAVGFSLSLVRVTIWLPAVIIGLTTFFLSAGGVLLGALCGSRLQQWSRAAGGIVLILIGLRLLLAPAAA